MSARPKLSKQLIIDEENVHAATKPAVRATPPTTATTTAATAAWLNFAYLHQMSLVFLFADSCPFVLCYLPKWSLHFKL